MTVVTSDRRAAAPTSASLQVTGDARTTLNEQRKVVTILFADLSGSTPLGERLDPEELRGILTSYFSVLSREIQRFGGTIDKYIGDAVMAVFGAPVAHEDDPERAVRAAVGMQRAMAAENLALERKYGVRLTLRIGVNTGEVVAGLLGGETQFAYTVVGDAVNTAQRLESAAPPNEVLVGEVTYQLTRHAFSYEALPPIALKGKREPVPVFRVIGSIEAPSFADAPAFVGREAELVRLRGWCAEADGGHGRVIHLIGEPGVGKSRLIFEFLAALPPGTVSLRARSVSYERESPYAVVTDLIRRALGVEPGADEATVRSRLSSGHRPLPLPNDETATALFLELLGHPQRSLLTPEAKRRMLALLLKRSIEARSEIGTLVLVLEDLHWVDEGSRAVLGEALADVPRRRCLVLALARDGSAAAWPGERMELAPLDGDAALRMAESLGLSDVDPSIRGSVVERTAGNPLFIQELVRTLAAGRTGRVPATVHELLQARLDDLSPSAKRVAQRAAVIGRSFSGDLLARLLPDESLPPALALLEREHFVALSGTALDPTYTFRHALMQEVAYETQLLAERRALHGQVGMAMEALYAGRLDEFVDALAFHHGRGDDDSRALTWLTRAAERARSLFANEQAIGLYRSAVERARDGDGPLEAGDILERLSDVQRIAGHYDDAIETVRRARERIPAPRPDTAARLHRKAGQALRVKGRYDDAAAAFAAGLEALAGNLDIEEAWIRIGEAELEWRRGELRRGRELTERAAEVSKRLGVTDAIAESLNRQGIFALYAGDYAAAERHWRDSLALYEQLGDVFSTAAIHANIGIVCRRLARYDEALAEHERSLTLRQRTGSPWAIGGSYHNIGEVHRSRGDSRQALVAYRLAIETWSPSGYPSGVAKTYMLMGAAQLDAGALVAAKDALARAQEQEAQLDRTDLPDLYRYSAVAALRSGELDLASELAQRSLELAKAGGSLQQRSATATVLGEIAIARGDLDGGRALIEESRRLLQGSQELDELRRVESALRALASGRA